MRLPRRSRALLIGASSYRDVGLPDLPAVARNLSDLQKVLTDPDLGGLSGWPRKFVGVGGRGHGPGSWPSPARWMVQAVSRASCGVPVGRPVRRIASW